MLDMCAVAAARKSSYIVLSKLVNHAKMHRERCIFTFCTPQIDNKYILFAIKCELIKGITNQNY